MKRSPCGRSRRLSLPAGVAAFIIALCCQTSFAQQPFITDDADVTPRHKFHFEFSNEFDVLQRASFPSLKQNVVEFELDYGLFENVEIGVVAPLITIVNDRSGAFRSPTGIGDMSVAMKYNFLKEREGSRLPAMAITASFEVPTGSVRRQLGSGLFDFYVNGILQKSINKKTKLRLNGGLLFSGNQTIGVEGVSARGLVLTGGASWVRQFTPKLDLGVEINGASTKKFNLAKSRLVFAAGGNYRFKSNMTIDFALVAGRYAASPRAGVQLGLSVDF